MRRKGGIGLDDAQLRKGVLEGCVLAIIARGETYGYEILSVLSEGGFDDLMEGTLYPVLTRLQKKGLLSCRMGKSLLGPMRKYFSVTPEGEAYLAAFTESYVHMTRAAMRILSQDGEEGETQEKVSEKESSLKDEPVS